MKKQLFAVMAAVAAMVAFGASRPMPEYLKSAVVYQIVLHNFTHTGTFKAAMALLPHVRSTGADVVYLTPFFEMDRDMDRKYWSPRQIGSGYDSPLNPYRIKNYNKIDPIYGTEKDFDAFCAKAHSLGMKVYLDLVYLHCGPTCVLKDLAPDTLQRNADGSLKVNEYNSFRFSTTSQRLRGSISSTRCSTGSSAVRTVFAAMWAPRCRSTSGRRRRRRAGR